MPGSGASLNVDVFPGVFEGRDVRGCAQRRREMALVWAALVRALTI